MGKKAQNFKKWFVDIFSGDIGYRFRLLIALDIVQSRRYINSAKNFAFGRIGEGVLPEIMQLIEALISADHKHMRIVTLGNNISKQRRKLEIKSVFAADSDLHILDVRLSFHNEAVHLKTDGVGILTVEYYYIIIRIKSVYTDKTLRFYIFKVYKICLHINFLSILK